MKLPDRGSFSARVVETSTMPDPLFGLITPACYDTLLVQRDLLGPAGIDCAKKVVAKLLGTAILFGSFALKLPQIFKILKRGGGASPMPSAADGLLLPPGVRVRAFEHGVEVALADDAGESERVVRREFDPATGRLRDVVFGSRPV